MELHKETLSAMAIMTDSSTFAWIENIRFCAVSNQIMTLADSELWGRISLPLMPDTVISFTVSDSAIPTLEAVPSCI